MFYYHDRFGKGFRAVVRKILGLFSSLSSRIFREATENRS